jgi:hypothetical protein
MAAYHWNGHAAALFGPVALVVAIVWALLTLLLVSARAEGRWRVAIWLGIVLSMPWIVQRNLELTWPNLLPHGFHLPSILCALLVWLPLVLLWRPAYSRRYEGVIEFATTVFAFAAISGAVFLSEMTWFWWQARALNDPLPLHAEGHATAPDDLHPRVIWIVLDELSYQQVYERRYPGLELPAFDALAGQSTVFTDVAPAGIETDRVLPSLLTGTPVDDIRPSAAGMVSTHNPVTARWQRFDQHNTIFQDALNAGDNTAAAGWYNPYCRIMPAVLERCYWAYGDTLANGELTEGTFKANVLGVLGALLGKGTAAHIVWGLLRIPGGGPNVWKPHVEDFKSILAAADGDLEDGSINFMLLHLPVPHPPGFYDRKTGQLTAMPTTYMDNLALADRYLAHVRALLEQRGEWDSSTVVVMGDHSWRTQLLWVKSPVWTAEEERASGGGAFDPRPAYIVKLAGQQTGARIDTPFRAVETRALLDALLARKIRSAGDLKAWVEQNH